MFGRREKGREVHGLLDPTRNEFFGGGRGQKKSFFFHFFFWISLSPYSYKGVIIVKKENGGEGDEGEVLACTCSSIPPPLTPVKLLFNQNHLFCLSLGERKKDK